MKKTIIGLFCFALLISGLYLWQPWNTPTAIKEKQNKPTSEPTRAPEVEEKPLTKAQLKKKPNIVEILVDDMRYDDFQYMPQLQKMMASEGRFMANAFSNYPLCCPARASFLTGQLPHNHKVYHVNDAYGYGSFDDRSTLGTSLKAAGYNTAFMGKYLNNYGAHTALAPIKEWQREGKNGPKPEIQSQYYVPAGWDEWRAGLQGVHCKPACGNEYSYWSYAYSHNGTPSEAPKGMYATDFVTNEAIQISNKFKKKRDFKGNPFFLSVNYVAPHNGGGNPEHDPIGQSYREHQCWIKSPSAPTWAYEDPAVKTAVPMGLTRSGKSEEDMSDKVGRWAKTEKLSTCELEATQNMVHARAAAVRAIDANIEKLVKDLKSKEEWKNTVFLFWSDNGYYQGEHQKPSGKSSIHEASLRVPMFFTGPGMRQVEKGKGIWGGKDVYSPVNIPDLTATIVDFADAKAPHVADGKTFRSALTGGEETGFNNLVVYESALTDAEPGEAPTDGDYFERKFDKVRDPRKVIGLRTGQYTYARYDNGEGELYDNVADPQQWYNLMKDKQWLRKHGRLIFELDKLVRFGAQCKGVNECQVALPKNLQMRPKALKRTTREWYDARWQIHLMP